ncbi:endolytic transglycosylase MltG [Candidatus Nomurabacteria bacterium]|nr:endolytic transglycosylase MltG [Candidatus Nomurabacteria bacterium]
MENKITIKLYLVILFCFLSVLFLYYFFISAPEKFPVNNIYNIETGVSLRHISKDLRDLNIIRSRFLFESFTILYGGEKHLAEGDYLFDKKISVIEVARRITYKERHLAPIKITIPEGFNNEDISTYIFLKLSKFNKDKFILLSKEKQGYLFPDTYFFFSASNENDVLKAMSDNFNKKINPILSEIKDSGKSEKDIIVMASLIEREAKGDEDRAIISGILWNRIAKKMSLQVDAYPETYNKKGLPENPICNPGLKAIKSAIHPQNSNYLYYLHDKNGIVHYAVTFTEHKNNIKKYLK